MNITTLNKYWKELEHFKNGGSLQARIWVSDPNDGDTCYSIWYEVGSEGWDIDKVFNYDLEYSKVQIIINDSYSHYRKALAEGKTVQYNFGNYGINRKDFPNIWKDLDISVGILADRAHPDNYRIKPEEPKFKVGDWVIHNGNLKKVTKVVNGLLDCLDKQPAVIMKDESLELWEPQSGEWCWFWNNLQHPFIAKFEKYGKNGLYYPQNFSATWHCEPFIGELPSILKDTQ